jgi:hypothetical protein
MLLFNNLNKNKGLRFFIINLFCILFFSLIYYIEDVIYFNEKTYMDYFYFSLVTQTMVGYGDITPRDTGIMRFISCCQLMSILFILSIH